jgi:two-component system response regulator (stage 0 sporulation protein F)
VNGVKVLVCDDERDIRILYRSAFEVAGAEVAMADDGDTAIDEAERYQPDVIVLDLRMPRRAGLEALPDLQRVAPGAKILVVSAHLLVDQFSRIRELGVEECFDKMDFLGRIPSLVAKYSTAA